MNLWVSFAAFNIFLSVAVFVFNMVRSWRRGPKAAPNPWRAHTLEWQVASPPPIQNFEHIPTVSEGPYEYGGAIGVPAEGRPPHDHPCRDDGSARTPGPHGLWRA